MTTTHPPTTIKTNSLVALDPRKLNGPTATVLSQAVMDEYTVNTDLADAGWQLAMLHGSRARVFVRLTNDDKFVGDYLVRKVEVAAVDTAAVFDEQADRWTVVATVGEEQPTGWTHQWNVEVA